jgi:hypothetical protein
MRLLDSPDYFNVNTYNALTSVEEADKIVRAENKIDEFLSRSQALFFLHNVQSRFGVALLHRHYPCERHELVLQDEHVLNGERVLIAQPEPRNITGSKKTPWLWTLSGEQFCPIEFTSDELAHDLLHSDLISEEFLEGFTCLLTKSPVGSLFGLAIVERSLYKLAKPEESPIEYSNSEERQNIIFLRNDPTVNSIETSWVFREYIDPMLACEGYTTCGSTCRKTNCVGRCISTNGDHKYVHSSGHSQHHIPQYEHK